MIAVDYTVEGKSYTLHDEFETKEVAIAALKALEKRSDIKINITQFSETIPVIFHYEIICDGEIETHQKEFQSEWKGYQWIRSQLGHPFMSFGKISVAVKK